ncbi:putative wall-associated receptor kinase, galacturonan-binding domain-containing protein [Helianthus annuus]|nr:putative wall-associated receptor kinase, galacturonan-binding domain-containing protein [Helianthus annuus]KAJ0955254.1 putative wall-associated receptor kinase, galacturonan-binding domain-containing protein [Helianthus annuus]
MFTRNILLLLFMIKTFCLTETSSQPLPGCQERCGTVTIPYPFGITSNCSAHQTYSITCNTSFNPPRPFITNNNLEVLEISLEGTARVNNPLLTYNCSGRTDHLDVNFTDTPFTYSSTSTRFTAIGCNNLALISRLTTVIGGCISLCNITRAVNEPNEHEQSHVRVRSLRKLTCSRTVHERIPNISLRSCSFVKETQLFTNSS